VHSEARGVDCRPADDAAHDPHNIALVVGADLIDGTDLGTFESASAR
jgi:hypothetical protein